VGGLRDLRIRIAVGVGDVGVSGGDDRAADGYLSVRRSARVGRLKPSRCDGTEQASFDPRHTGTTPAPTQAWRLASFVGGGFGRQSASPFSP
jgi:hypothetical protein